MKACNAHGLYCGGIISRGATRWEIRKGSVPQGDSREVAESYVHCKGTQHFFSLW